MTEVLAAKAAGRELALAAREAVHGVGASRQAAGLALAEIASHKHIRMVAGYLAMGTELDPAPVMLALHGLGIGLCVPVVEGKGRPLAFRVWTPGCETVEGTFGVRIPEDGAAATPDLLLVPLLAFDDEGYRLGYGGGFYDRTLAQLRAAGPVVALGLAFAGQQVEAVPREPVDERLDAVVTERGILRPD